MEKFTLTGISIATLLAWHSNAFSYQSTYDELQWEPRGQDTQYCLDVTDENWNIYPGLQAIACGENLYRFSPRQYVHDVYHIELAPGFTFYWRVWSPGGYGGNGFEGVVRVGEDCGLPYRSDAEGLQWGCRFRDTYYCLDIFDADWKVIATPHVCGENLHSFDPRELRSLNLSTGTYYWKVWSPSAYDYWREQKYFEGQFKYQKPPEALQPAQFVGPWKSEEEGVFIGGAGNHLGSYLYLNGNLDANGVFKGYYDAYSCVLVPSTFGVNMHTCFRVGGQASAIAVFDFNNKVGALELERFGTNLFRFFVSRDQKNIELRIVEGELYSFISTIYRQ
jgi:hypothetical protein